MKYTSDAHRVIVQELERHLRTPLQDKTRIALPCPFHKETQPSLYVNITASAQQRPGSYYCFGCKARPSTHGGWNGLAKALGLATIDGVSSQVTTYVPHRMPVEDMHDPDEGWDIDDLLAQWNCGFHTQWVQDVSWRGVPGWLMRKIGAWMSFDDEYERQVCILPQWNEDILVGAVKAQCRVYKTTRVKYLSAPGPWVKTHALFPFHVAQTMLARRKDRSVFLVEGPRDAIRLIGCGIPALALLGTNNWTEEKRDLLMTLDPDRVFLAFDNDRAGQGAIDLVSPTIKGFADRVRVQFKGDGKIDPGNVPIEQIRAWKTRWGVETTAVRELADHYH